MNKDNSVAAGCFSVIASFLQSSMLMRPPSASEMHRLRPLQQQRENLARTPRSSMLNYLPAR